MYTDVESLPCTPDANVRCVQVTPPERCPLCTEFVMVRPNHNVGKCLEQCLTCPTKVPSIVAFDFTEAVT